MEKLLAGEDGTSERRKSIKTYREIVQEKWVLSVVVVNVQYYLGMLFLKIVHYHKGSDTSIIPFLCHPFSSTLVPTKRYFAIFVTVVDFVIASLFHSHPLGSGEKGSCMRHIRMHSPRRRQRESFNSTLRGSLSAKLFLNAWRCQKSWKEAIQQSQTYLLS